MHLYIVAALAVLLHGVHACLHVHMLVRCQHACMHGPCMEVAVVLWYRKHADACPVIKACTA